LLHSVATDLSPEPASARQARQELEPVRDLLGETRFGDLRLLVSELVVEAIGGSGKPHTHPISMRVEWDQAEVRALVRQGAESFPTSSTTPEPGEPGWSLYLVQTVSDRWGLSRAPDSAAVWFEMATPSDSPE
jgi:hypothetical protein